MTKDAVQRRMRQSARRSTRRWSTPTWRAARSTISSASRSRRCCGASCRAPARPAACSRWRCASSATASSRSRPSGRRNTGRSSRRSRPSDGGAFDARLVGADGKKITPPRHRQRRGGGGLQARRSRAAPSRSPRSRRSRSSAIPPPPFTTSTLQQEASRKLGLAPARTMQIAQRLYEGVDIGGETVGLITYMRTDGVDMAPEAVAAARRVIGKEFGDALRAGRAAQIHDQGQERAGGARGDPPDRPGRLPSTVARYLDPEQARLYELIWKRTIASQMESAELERTTVDIAAKAAPRKLDLRATGQVVQVRRLPDALPGGPRRRGGRGRGPPAADEAQGDRCERRRIAASSISPSRRRAIPKRASSSAWRSSASAGPRPMRRSSQTLRDRDYVAHREEAPRPRGQGPHRHGVPRELLRALCRVRFHRRPRREARPGLGWRDRLEGGAARLLARLLGRHRRDQGTAHRPRCSTR